MPASIRSMHLEHVFRNVQTDRGSLLHGRLLRWLFDTVTLAHRCRREASTLYHRGRLVRRSHMLARRVHPLFFLLVTMVGSPIPQLSRSGGYPERQVWGQAVRKRLVEPARSGSGAGRSGTVKGFRMPAS